MLTGSLKLLQIPTHTNRHNPSLIPRGCVSLCSLSLVVPLLKHLQAYWSCAGRRTLFRRLFLTQVMEAAALDVYTLSQCCSICLYYSELLDITKWSSNVGKWSDRIISHLFQFKPLWKSLLVLQRPLSLPDSEDKSTCSIPPCSLILEFEEISLSVHPCVLSLKIIWWNQSYFCFVFHFFTCEPHAETLIWKLKKKKMSCLVLPFELRDWGV